MSAWPEGELGPVQALLLSIDTMGSDEMISAELQDLGNETAIRVIDLLRVRRDRDGEVRRMVAVDPTGMPGTLVEALLFAGANRGDPRPREPKSGESWFLADPRPPGAAGAHPLVAPPGARPPRAAVGELEAENLGDAWLHPRDVAAARRQARPAPG